VPGRGIGPHPPRNRPSPTVALTPSCLAHNFLLRPANLSRLPLDLFLWNREILTIPSFVSAKSWNPSIETYETLWKLLMDREKADWVPIPRLDEG
jgi:hypothetical protein